MKKVLRIVVKILYDHITGIVSGLIVCFIVGASEFTPIKIYSSVLKPIIFSYYSGWIVFLLLLLFVCARYLRSRYNYSSAETIKCVPRFNSNRWSLGAHENRTITHFICKLHVTNISEVNIFLLTAKLERHKSDGWILVQHHQNNMFGSYPILPGHIAEVHISFGVMGVKCKKGKSCFSRVMLTDQLGNHHKIDKIEFLPTREKQVEPPGPPSEEINKINDPIEKQIAAVLQAEIDRYKNCGRRVGGLGSIQTTYKQQTHKGVGGDSREPDSPRLQSICIDPNANIHSDNALILTKYYNSLKSDDKDTFIKCILKRLTKETAYAVVGYFIIFVCFRIGELPKALETAKSKLRNDGAHCFSNVLMLLDGLLKYEHKLFTSEMLDEVEHFLEGIDEYTFRIHERINVVRTMLLKKILVSPD